MRTVLVIHHSPARAVQVRQAFGQFRGDLASVHRNRAVRFDDWWKLLLQLR